MVDHPYSKAERLAELFRRLEAAPPSIDFDGAYRLLCETLDAVEDEMQSAPNIPENWMTDGRMYPPQLDNARKVVGRPGFVRFRNRDNSTIIGPDGSIEVVTVKGQVLFSKARGLTSAGVIPR